MRSNRWTRWEKEKPPDCASGCIEARVSDDLTIYQLYLFHTTSGSHWGHCIRTFKEHGEQVTIYPQFSEWRYTGPKLLPADGQGKVILVWRFDDAPGQLKALSTNGGDEDWLALLPVEFAEAWIPWLDTDAFSCCSIDTHKLPDGRVVRIGSHA